MVRECVASLLFLPAPGCSWILDFSEPPALPDAAPGLDASPYEQADCDYKEPNDTAQAAAILAATDTGPAAICSGSDHDFYKLAIDATTTAVELRITHDAALGDLDLVLRDKAGTPIAASRGFGDLELITCPGTSPPCAALTADDYLLEVFPATPGVTNRYTIAITTTAP